MRKNATGQGGRGIREETGLRGERNKNQVQNPGNGMKFKNLKLAGERSITPRAGSAFGRVSSPGHGAGGAGHGC